jgi:hypothetical protein
MPYKEKSMKRASDQKYSAAKYEQFRIDKDHVCLNVLGGECYICGDDEDAQNFHLHHVVYDEEESAYARNSKSFHVRRKRLDEAMEHPERFKLLCPACHRSVSSVQGHVQRMVERAGQRKRLDEEAIKRFYEVL